MTKKRMPKNPLDAWEGKTEPESSKAQELKQNEAAESKSSETTEAVERNPYRIRPGAKKVGIVLPVEWHRELRIMAAEQGTNVSRIIEEALRRYAPDRFQ